MVGVPWLAMLTGAYFIWKRLGGPQTLAVSGVPATGTMFHD
jgi:hypothetical protein